MLKRDLYYERIPTKSLRDDVRYLGNILGRVMGHAGAIVSAYGESAVEKVELLKECGVIISKNPSVMGETVKSALNSKT